MTMRHSLCLAVAIASVGCLSSPVHAAFRCGMNKIVSEGASASSVLLTCGDPVAKRTLSGSGADWLVEEWTYKDYEDARWVKILRFENGTLVKIEGYRP